MGCGLEMVKSRRFALWWSSGHDALGVVGGDQALRCVRVGRDLELR